MKNTPAQKRTFSFGFCQNLEEDNQLICTKNCCVLKDNNNNNNNNDNNNNDNNNNDNNNKTNMNNILYNTKQKINDFMLQTYNDSDGPDKNPNKNSNKKNKKNKDNKKSSKSDKPVYTEQNNRTTRSHSNNKNHQRDNSSESNLSDRNNTSKRTKYESDKEREEEWDDYDFYFNNYINKNIIVPCDNSTCDHIIHQETWYDEHKITISSVNTLDDLIFLGNHYHCKMRMEYNGIDMKILHSLKEPLTELNNMIGLGKIKEEIVNTIIYFLLTKNLNKEINSDMMHAVITGSPGCGKTTFIEILAKIYVSLGVLKKGHIVKTRRSELIGKYLGHTAVQTQKKIEEAHGGILLIDEAYALGNPEGRDSFAKECLDTLNQALSEQKADFICIIAGYKDALETSFFKYNEGLKRRFPFKYEIDKYSSDELSMILYKKLEEYGHYGIHKDSIFQIEFIKKQLQNLIKDNYKYFVNQGGDMETLFLGAKIAQNKRVFLLEVGEKKKLLLSDIKTSITKFIELHKLKDDHDDFMLKSMYI